MQKTFKLAQCRRREAFIQRFQDLIRIDPTFVHDTVIVHMSLLPCQQFAKCILCLILFRLGVHLLLATAWRCLRG